MAIGIEGQNLLKMLQNDPQQYDAAMAALSAQQGNQARTTRELAEQTRQFNANMDLAMKNLEAKQLETALNAIEKNPNLGTQQERNAIYTALGYPLTTIGNVPTTAASSISATTGGGGMGVGSTRGGASATGAQGLSELVKTRGYVDSLAGWPAMSEPLYKDQSRQINNAISNILRSMGG